jgi:Domain of unknown function (DUF4168)
MKPTIGLGAAMTLVAAGLLFAHAQGQPSSPPAKTAPDAASPANIPDKKLDAVAAAAKRVVSVSDTYKDKLAKAPEAEKEKIVGEANQAITKAVTDQGLSVEEYVSIMKVAQDDPAVRDRLVQRLK